MQRTYKVNNNQPRGQVELTFQPSTIIVLNNTDQSLYMRFGSTMQPGSTLGSYDREILPTSSGIPSNIALPNVCYMFSWYLPMLTDATKEVTITFQGTADPFTNKSKLLFPAARRY